MKLDGNIGITSDFIKGKDGSIIIVDILALIVLHRQKELSETKGKVISDFQDYLGKKQWLR